MTIPAPEARIALIDRVRGGETADAVYALASQQLPTIELGRLAQDLRVLNPAWRLSRAQQVTLAHRLIERHVPQARVALMVGLQCRSLQHLLDTQPAPRRRRITHPARAERILGAKAKKAA